MLLILSPAKKQNFEQSALIHFFTQPDFLDQSTALIELLKQKFPAELSALMGISEKLAVLNAGRYEAWHLPFTPENAKQALFAFDGDVYRSLDAKTLGEEAIAFLQSHLRILSGLYGILRPLDLIQPYRLEMAVPLANPLGDTLYDYWQNTVTHALNRMLDKMPEPVLVNLASNEYFKSVNQNSVNGAIITPIFQENQRGQYKTIGIYAKRARGMMARWIARQKILHVEEIKLFTVDGYCFNHEHSDLSNWIFRRNHHTI